MQNTLQENSVSVKVHQHMLQMAVSDKQLPPFNIDNVYLVSTKPKCRMTSKEVPFSNQVLTVHQVLFTKWTGSMVIAEVNLINKFYRIVFIMVLYVLVLQIVL